MFFARGRICYRPSPTSFASQEFLRHHAGRGQRDQNTKGSLLYSKFAKAKDPDSVYEFLQRRGMAEAGEKAAAKAEALRRKEEKQSKEAAKEQEKAEKAAAKEAEKKSGPGCVLSRM